jgi:hypothetical protein
MLELVESEMENSVEVPLLLRVEVAHLWIESKLGEVFDEYNSIF